MTYTLNKGMQGITFTAYRYDIVDRSIAATVMPELPQTLPPQWAADSKRYLIGGVDGMHYVEPDGAMGDSFTAEGGIIRQYSPRGDQVIIEPPLPFPDGEPALWKTAKVVDVSTGRIVRRIPSAVVDLGVPTTSPLLGWYDNDRVVRFAPDSTTTTIEVVEVATGWVTKRILAPDLYPLSYIDLRPTTILGRAACPAGF